ncbi:MAG: TonB-dependent receptor [Vicinamibacterales bacterium]
MTLYGRVTDASGGVLPGVAVTIASPQLITGEQSTVTDASGEWRIPNLPPGTYTIKVELSGFNTMIRERVTAQAGAQIGTDFALAVSAIEESVTVVGESPIVDTRSTRQVHTVDTKLIEEVPMSGRTYADVINALPGITDGSKYTYSLTQTVHGSGVRDNDYVIDGQSTKHPSGYSGTEFSIEAIEEVQVTTGGISAEFGQASGGVFTFVTKSGGDQFKGTLYSYLVDEALQGDNVTSDLERQGIDRGNAIVRDLNYGVNLGGPILRQKLWFFGDLNLARSEESIAGFPLANVEDSKRLIFAKGTWQVSPNNRFSGSFNHQRRWMLPSNPGADYRLDPRAWRKQYWLPKLTSLQWTSVLGRNLMLEAQGGMLKVVEDNTFPLGSFDPSEVNGYADIGSGVNYGTWDRARGRFDGRDHWDLKANMTYFAGTFLGGTHEIKAGFHREKGWTQRWNVIPNNLLLRLRSAPTCLSLDCAVPLDVALHAGPADTQDEYLMYNAYAQDQWSFRNGLTLNLGLRFERTDGWTPEQRQGADLVPNGFDPDEDGNSNTFPTIAWFPSQVWPERRGLIDWKSVAPRLGMTWDASGTSRFVVKASYGRWHSKVGQEVGSGNPNSLRSARHDWLDCRNAAGTPILCQGLPASQVNGDLLFQPEELGRLLATNVLSPARFANVVTHDPNLRQPYVDAFNFGFEVGLTADFSVGVQGIYKKYGDVIGSLDPSRRPFDQFYDPVQVANPVTSEPMTIYLQKPHLASLPTQTFLSNPPEAEASYRGVELVARKRFSNRWQMLGSYLVGEATGNIGTHFNDGIGRSVTNPNQLINSAGPLSLDSTHQFKMSGSFHAPAGVILGLSYLGMTGYPIRSFVSEIGGGFGGSSYFQFIRGRDYPAVNAAGVQYTESSVTLPIDPRGSRRVDFRNMLNLRAEKTFSVGTDRRLGVLLDVLNVFNSSAVTHVQAQRIEFVNYLLPELIEAPVRARIGVRFLF